MVITFDLDNINEAAAQFLQAAGNARVFAFHGQMGAGKTTFIHVLCRLKGASGPFSSPTFSIINEYASPEGPVYHIDLYRLAQEEEAFRAGVEDCLYSGHTCFVEWPGQAEGLFPEETLQCTLEVIDHSLRRLTLSQ
jgi:tRNA threonylcarbamoyladenosine biosynthesis protein TsaE